MDRGKRTFCHNEGAFVKPADRAAGNGFSLSTGHLDKLIGRARITDIIDTPRR